MARKLDSSRKKVDHAEIPAIAAASAENSHSDKLRETFDVIQHLVSICMHGRPRFACELHCFVNEAQTAVDRFRFGELSTARRIAQDLGVKVPAPSNADEKACVTRVLSAFVNHYCERRGGYPVPEPPNTDHDSGDLTVWFVRSLWAPVRTKNVWVTSVLRLVQTDYALPHVPIEQVADAAHLSTPYFRRLIQRWAGAEMSLLIRWERVARAQWHLSRTAMAIKAVARLVGYPSESQFDRDFKYECGLTPREFRAIAQTVRCLD